MGYSIDFRLFAEKKGSEHRMRGTSVDDMGDWRSDVATGLQLCSLGRCMHAYSLQISIPVSSHRPVDDVPVCDLFSFLTPTYI